MLPVSLATEVNTANYRHPQQRTAGTYTSTPGLKNLILKISLMVGNSTSLSYLNKVCMLLEPMNSDSKTVVKTRPNCAIKLGVLVIIFTGMLLRMYLSTNQANSRAYNAVLRIATRTSDCVCRSIFVERLCFRFNTIGRHFVYIGLLRYLCQVL